MAFEFEDALAVYLTFVLLLKYVLHAWNLVEDLCAEEQPIDESTSFSIRPHMAAQTQEMVVINILDDEQPDDRASCMEVQEQEQVNQPVSRAHGLHLPMATQTQDFVVVNISDFGGEHQSKVNNTKNNDNKFRGCDNDRCAICLSGSRAEGPCLWTVLPQCKHGFHAKCITSWLGINRTCPMCRKFVLP